MVESLANANKITLRSKSVWVATSHLNAAASYLNAPIDDADPVFTSDNEPQLRAKALQRLAELTALAHQLEPRGGAWRHLMTVRELLELAPDPALRAGFRRALLRMGTKSEDAG